ncbi:type II toxin-antitoxin system RelE/ParE family toxin [Nocardioides sp. LML1-1-1.1]|uniref:type II toxin-antitoxin system RelE/ParE family toxin n=1 Tax=Nocardioides sp. LML1-1-1.1 TaxID=3135248 RepID=UPI003449B179
MIRRLLYSPEAVAQLEALEKHVLDRAGPAVAGAYLDRLLAFCDEIAVEPVVGRRRDDLLPGLMTRTFERRRVICFLELEGGDIHVLAVFGGSEDWERRLSR